MNQREFGRSGIKLSSITFGSMRLDPKLIELDAAVELIAYLHENGINTFHSSHEYASDRFFCQVMQQFRSRHPGAEIVHIAKIGVPHFDETEFSSAKLISLIENRLKQLDTERIDLVQWLVRHQPNEDRYRLPILAECQSELSHTWSRLQQEGKVGVLASFPYTVPFAQAALQFAPCRGLVTYLNLLELEMVPLLTKMEDAGQGYVAIRPLGGGLITTENFTSPQADKNYQNQLETIITRLNIPASDLTQLAVQFPLLHPVVTSVMISVTSLKHAAEVIAAADRESDRHAFQEILQAVDSTKST